MFTVKGIRVESYRPILKHRSILRKSDQQKYLKELLPSIDSRLNNVYLPLIQKCPLQRRNNRPLFNGGLVTGTIHLIPLSRSIARELNFLAGVDRSITKFAYTLAGSIADG